MHVMRVQRRSRLRMTICIKDWSQPQTNLIDVVSRATVLRMTVLARNLLSHHQGGCRQHRPNSNLHSHDREKRERERERKRLKSPKASSARGREPGQGRELGRGASFARGTRGGCHRRTKTPPIHCPDAISA